jgi:DNA replication protein DnaC
MRKGERKSQEGIKIRKIKKNADGNPIYQTETQTVNGQQISRQVPVYETTIDNKPIYELQPNYRETDDREAIAKLLRCFELFQFDLISYYERARHLFNPYSFSPPGHYEYDYETGRRRWVSQIQLEEEEEITGEGLPTRRKTDKDDLAEEEYNNLPTDQKEPTYKLERLKRYRLRLLEAIKRNSGMTKTLEEDRLKRCERLIEIARATPVKVTKQEFLDYVRNVEGVVGFEDFINEIAADLEFAAHLDSIGAKEPRVFYYVLVGPPGVGKSMICGIIARALKKHYGKIGLGGQANPSLLYGSPPTFKGTNFGKVLQILTDKRNKDESSVMLIDEFEKAKDPSLLDVISNVLDPEFNKEFYDVLFEFDIDISKT